MGKFLPLVYGFSNPGLHSRSLRLVTNPQIIKLAAVCIQQHFRTREVPFTQQIFPEVELNKFKSSYRYVNSPDLHSEDNRLQSLPRHLCTQFTPLHSELIDER